VELRGLLKRTTQQIEVVERVSRIKDDYPEGTTKFEMYRVTSCYGQNICTRQRLVGSWGEPEEN